MCLSACHLALPPASIVTDTSSPLSETAVRVASLPHRESAFQVIAATALSDGFLGGSAPVSV